MESNTSSEPEKAVKPPALRSALDDWRWGPLAIVGGTWGLVVILVIVALIIHWAR